MLNKERDPEKEWRGIKFSSKQGMLDAFIFPPPFSPLELLD